MWYHYLNMDSVSIEDQLQKITENLVRKFQPEKVVLFGSYAYGQPGPDSDVDLLVVKEVNDVRRLRREIDGSIFPRPFPIDLIVYTPEQLEQAKDEGDFFITEILTKGQFLYDMKGKI